MNEELIRKAVELADRWRIVESWVDHLDEDGEIECEHPCFHSSMKLPQYMLDALAAQLVRQVTEAGFSYVITKYRTTIHGMACNAVGEASGPDPSANTIYAVVDSGVLG